MRTAILLLLCSFGLFASGSGGTQPQNMHQVMIDTVFVDSTETEYSNAFYPAEGAAYALVLEINDTNTAGITNDSAVLDVDAYHGFQLGTANWILAACTTKVDDSLDIKETDTSGSVWLRNAIPIRDGHGDTISYSYGDALSSVSTNTGGIFVSHKVFNSSPALFLKLRGLTRNAKRGAGTRVVIRWYQIRGNAVRVK